MATPKYGVAYTFYISLVSQADTKLFQNNPTLATGDFTITKDGGASANLATLPVVTPASSRRVKVALSATEMEATDINIMGVDASGAEWCDVSISIQTNARALDDLAYPATSGRSLAVDASGQVTVGALATDTVTAAALAADAVAEINATVDTAISDAALATAANLATVDGIVDSILVDTNELQTDWVDAGRLDLLVDAIKAKTDNLPAAPAATGDIPTAAAIRAEVDSNSTQLAAIVADTNELQTELADGGRTDLLIDGIKAVTDALPDSGALTTLQSGVDAIPTNAELATALAAADDAVLAAIAALNNLSAAQVNAQVVDALATDTYAELAAVPAATSTLADKLNWLFALARNKLEQTATTQTLYADDGTTSVAASTVSDDATTATRGEWA